MQSMHWKCMKVYRFKTLLIGLYQMNNSTCTRQGSTINPRLLPSALSKLINWYRSKEGQTHLYSPLIQFLTLIRILSGRHEVWSLRLSTRITTWPDNKNQQCLVGHVNYFLLDSPPGLAAVFLFVAGGANHLRTLPLAMHACRRACTVAPFSAQR